MGLYISEQQYNVIKEKLKIKADEYEKSRKPHVIHKFKASVFVDCSLYARFVHGEPDILMLGDSYESIAGSFSLSRMNEKDKKYSIPGCFQDF